MKVALTLNKMCILLKVNLNGKKNRKGIKSFKNKTDYIMIIFYNIKLKRLLGNYGVKLIRYKIKFEKIPKVSK